MADTAEDPQPQAPPPQTDKAPPPRPEKRPEIRPRKSLGRRMREHPIKLLVFLVVLAGVAIGGYRLWAYLESYESTDDAQIDGDIYAITSRITGTVKAVYVEDNQTVKAGQLLVELDPADYSVSLEQAKAALNESRTQVAVAQPNVPITSVSTETTLATSATDIAGRAGRARRGAARPRIRCRERPERRSRQRQSPGRSGPLPGTGRERRNQPPAVRSGGGSGEIRGGQRGCEARHGGSGRAQYRAGTGAS